MCPWHGRGVRRGHLQLQGRDRAPVGGTVQYVEHGVMSYLVFVVGCPEATDMYSHRHLRIVYISLSSWLCGQQCGHLPTQFRERLSSRREGKVLRCPSDPTESCIQPHAPFLIIVVDTWRPHCVRGSLRRCFFGSIIKCVYPCASPDQYAHRTRQTRQRGRSPANRATCSASTPRRWNKPLLAAQTSGGPVRC